MPSIDGQVNLGPTDARVRIADDISLHVRRWPGAGRPFLLVHGLSANARQWDEVAQALSAAGHPVTAVDLRSHGESDAPPAGYDTATAAADLAALRLLGAVVAGHSWGGNIAVKLAATRPELVAGLALVDGGWLDPAADFASWAECEAALCPPDIEGLPAAQLRGFLRDAHPDWSERALDATEANLRIWPDGRLTRRLSVDRHMRIVRSMWDDPPSSYYPAIGVPVLLIPALSRNSGRAAENLAKVRAASQALHHATIREYVDADHDLAAQHPRELAADLLALAQRVDAES